MQKTQRKELHASLDRHAVQLEEICFSLRHPITVLDSDQLEEVDEHCRNILLITESLRRLEDENTF